MNSTQLIAAVRQISTTDNDPDYDDAAILALLNSSLLDRFKAPMVTCRQGYWRQKKLITITAGQANYRVPRRTVDGVIEMVEIQDTSGGTFRPLVPQTQGQVYRYQRDGTPRAYAIDGDSINIRPTPTATATLRVTYPLMPSTLVAPQAVTAGYIFSAPSPGDLTLAMSATITVQVDPGPPRVDAPGNLASSVAIDIVRADGTFELSLVGVTQTLSTLTMTFPAGTDLSRVQVGDRVRQAGYSEWPCLPLGLHQALADYTAAVVLLNKGDLEKAKVFAGKASDAIERTVDVVTPRAKAQPPSLTPRYSYLRRGRGRR